jgi:hypothetical protein
MTGPIPGTTGLEQPAQFTFHAVRTAGSFGALDVRSSAIFVDLFGMTVAQLRATRIRRKTDSGVR